MSPFDLDLPGELRNMPLFQNSLLAWGIALTTAALLLIVLLAMRSFVRRQHRRMLDTERTELLEIPFEILSRATLLFCLVLSLVAGMSTLTMAEGTRRLVTSAFTIILFIQVGVWAGAAVVAWLERRRRRTTTTADRAVVGSLGIIGFIARVLIWSLVGLMILDNLGIDVTALVAGLGIGGIAVALAAQNVLGDLFASLSIAFDKPFLVGDFLILEDYLGSVEHIGIKSTRLRSLSGEQIILSNAELLKSRVRNYGRMLERRVVMTHGVTYDTPIEKIERIPAIIRAAIEAQKDTRFDRSHFAKHGSTSLDFESVYYVLSADYNRYMDIQQAINLKIHRQFAELAVEFAFPTQTLYLSRTRTESEDTPGKRLQDRARAG
ncbi:MAG: mechanosensitive ion channel family protein [Pseudomonadota bacterium]